MTRSLRAARIVAGVSAVLAPVVYASLGAAEGRPAWPIAVGLVAGLLVRALAGEAPLVLTAMAVAPVWQVAGESLPTTTVFESLMPWLAFLGAGLARPGPAPWRTPGWWVPAIAGWALVLTAAWPVVAARELDFTWRTIGAATVNGSWGASPVQTAGAVILFAQAQLLALLVFDWYCGATARDRRGVWWALAPGTAVACGVALWQQRVDLTFLSQAPWIALRRAAGTFFDANATGALIVLVGPVVASRTARPAAVPAPVWSGAWLVLVLAGVSATGSRTAIGGLVATLASHVLIRARGAHRAALVAVAGLAMAAVVTLGVSDRITGDAVSRLAGTVNRVIAEGPTGLWWLVWQREGYGPAAAAMAADHPWVGTGPGTFVGLVADYARRATGAPLPPDNAQNWWRHQLAELGGLGAVPGLVCSLLALAVVARAVGRREDVGPAASLVGLGLMLFVSAPTQHPIIQVVVGLVVARAVAVGVPAATTAVAPATAAGSVPATPWSGAVAWGLALACSVGLAVEGWREFRPPYRATRLHFAYSYGVTDTESTPFGDGRWMGRRAVAVIPPGGRTLVVRVVAPHEDLGGAPVAVTISSRSRVVCEHQARDHTPFECRVPVPHDAWPMVRVDVSRSWRRQVGMERAAVVSARFED